MMGIMTASLLLLSILATAPASGAAPSTPPAVPGAPHAEDDPERTLRLVLAGSPWDRFEVLSDGHFQGSTDFSAGLEGDLVWALDRHVRCGVGLRYELAHGPASSFRGAIYDHFLYARLLFGWRLPLPGRHELEPLFGLGVFGGLANDGPSPGRSVQVLGPTAEVSLSYWFPATRTLDVSLGAALSISVFKVRNSSQFEGEDGGRFVLPLRVGARWAL